MWLFLKEALIPLAYAQPRLPNTTRGWNIITFRTGGGVTQLFNLIIVILNWFLVAVTIIAFVYLVLSGVKYITSGGDATKATEARNGIIYAIIGLIVISLAFFIIRFAITFGTSGGGP